MKLEVLPGEFSVCKVRDYGEVDLSAKFVFTGATDGEKSLVCPTELVPAHTLAMADGWRGMRVEGPLDFSLVGVLSALSGVLAKAQVGIFAISTFDTDYLFVKEADLGRALAALRSANHAVGGAP
ncbi:MAG: ACT domain-containing protein [Kiritimatiellae bacterium]|nr:ACT domain-containing protein [Kiritimatiellia bacterium]